MEMRLVQVAGQYCLLQKYCSPFRLQNTILQHTDILFRVDYNSRSSAIFRVKLKLPRAEQFNERADTVDGLPASAMKGVVKRQ